MTTSDAGWDRIGGACERSRTIQNAGHRILERKCTGGRGPRGVRAAASPSANGNRIAARAPGPTLRSSQHAHASDVEME